jgi:hypothetical protein
MKRVATVSFVTLVLLSVAQAAWQHGRLPENVASHFDALGRPDAWGPRGTLTAWHIGTVLFIAGMFEGIARLNRLIPEAHLNIPHRAYWLAPERREDTLARLETMSRFLGGAVLAFLIGLFHQVYRANTGGGELTVATAFLVVGLLVAIAAILVAFLLRFARPPAG